MITFSKLGRYGQLGNQLFQYAMLLGVSAKTGREIRIPKNFRGIKKKDQVELEPFYITAGTLTEQNKTAIKNSYTEATFAFDPAVFEQPDGTDYAGYFQTEKYFDHAADRIRREFLFRADIQSAAAGYVLQLVARHDGRPIVAVHVRRGDYLKNPDRFHVLTPEYYARALATPELAQHNPVTLVFSDDVAWCIANFPGRDIHICRMPDHWHDLAVMSFCHHHIIGASSFSWWGAWLSKSREQVVIAPRPWFPVGVNLDSQDVVPDRWLRQDV